MKEELIMARAHPFKLESFQANFDALTKRDMAVCMSHVNSYCRDSLEWWCPIDMATLVLPINFTNALGIEKIPPKEVNLTPYLVPHAMVK